MIDTTWSQEFQTLLLACALRTNLLAETPLEPELFRGRDKGPKPPEQDVALITVDFFAKRGRTPTLEEFNQLVTAAQVGPERRRVIDTLMLEIRAVELPADLNMVRDEIREQMARRRIEQAMFQAAPELDKPGGLQRALEIMTRAMESSNGTVPGAAALETVFEFRERIGKTEWVVDRMFAVGDLSICVALPGTGKSYFNAQLAVDVAQGTPFLGRRTKQGPVVCLLFEGAKSTTDRMIDFGLDKDDDVLVWTADGDAKNPLTWLKGVLGDRKPVLIIIDTLTDFSRISVGASNAGYEETIGKLGSIYLWALNNRVHIHFSHHANKANVDEITGALGTIGIVGKPGTVLFYRKMNSQDEASPRVLKGVKHREGDVTTDLPAIALELDPTTRRLFPSGTQVQIQSEINVRDLGAAMIRVVRQTQLNTPTGIRQEELLAAVEGRKVTKLDALRQLTGPDGVLTVTGTAKSRTDPLMITLREAAAETTWQDRFTRRAAPVRDGEEV